MRMLSLQDEQRILENAPPYLRVAIVLLAQTGGRTYTEGLSLRWDQIDLEHNVIFFGGKTRTEGLSEPVPLTGLAPDVLLSWKKEQADKSPFLFPSPVKPDQPITTVKTAWKTTLKNAGVAHFPIYHLRHVFCTRLSWAAPDCPKEDFPRHRILRGNCNICCRLPYFGKKLAKLSLSEVPILIPDTYRVGFYFPLRLHQ